MKRLMTVLLCLGLLAALLGTAAAAEKNVPVSAAKSAAAKPAAAEVDSVALLEKVVARDSSKFDNLYRLGVMYLDREDAKSAIKVFSKARQLRPKDHRVLVNLGIALDQEGQHVPAQSSYRDALAQFPGDSIASCRLAMSLYAQNRYSEAMDIARDLIRRSPGAYCAYFAMGVAFADAGMYRDAIRMWQKVVDLAPSSPEAISAKESLEVLEKVVTNP